MAEYIWTDHALQRKRERKVSDRFVDETMRKPERKFQRSDGSLELQRRFENHTVSLIVKKNANEYVIVSCWVNPPMPGTKDFRRRKRYFIIQKSYGWKWIWNKLLYALGI